MKKIWVGIGIILVITLAVVLTIIRPVGEPEEIKIGAILPLTGDIASYGIRVKQGAEIAVTELRTQGLPVISIEFQDDQNIAKNAVSIMKTFGNIKHYPVVIGAAGSSVSMAIAPIANQYKVVQISPLSSSEELSTKGGDFFFRVCPADDQQAQVLAAWVVEKDYKKVAVVYTNNAWGEGLAKAFQKYYTELSDGQISLFEATEEGETDFRTVLAKIKAQGCDAIMSPTYPKEGGALVKQAKELGIGSALYGADNWGAPEFLQIAGSAADGSFFVAQYSYDGPEFQHLNTKFKKLTGKETDADVFVAYGYDTVYAIAHALTPAKSLNGPDIRQALLEVKFQGASGLIEFAPNGDLKTSAFVKKIISEGKPRDYEN